MGYYTQNPEMAPGVWPDDSLELRQIAASADEMLSKRTSVRDGYLGAVLLDGETNRKHQAARSAEANYAVREAIAIHYGNINGDLDIDLSLRFAAASKRIPEVDLDRRRHDANEALSYTDDLTGLLNKRAFRRDLEIATTLRERGLRNLGLLVFDPNEFKSVNDRYGHSAGDSVLQFTGKSLLATAKRYKNTYVYRIGGDEFALITGSTRLLQLLEACETDMHARLLGAKSLPFGRGEMLTGKEILDCGYRLIGGAGTDFESADKQLYERKYVAKYGSNRILQPVRRLLNPGR